MDLQKPRVTSDGGLILVRELDERLGLGELILNRTLPLLWMPNAESPAAHCTEKPLEGILPLGRQITLEMPVYFKFCNSGTLSEAASHLPLGVSNGY